MSLGNTPSSFLQKIKYYERKISTHFGLCNDLLEP